MKEGGNKKKGRKEGGKEERREGRRERRKEKRRMYVVVSVSVKWSTRLLACWACF